MDGCMHHIQKHDIRASDHRSPVCPILYARDPKKSRKSLLNTHRSQGYLKQFCEIKKWPRPVLELRNTARNTCLLDQVLAPLHPFLEAAICRVRGEVIPDRLLRIRVG